MKRFSLPVLLVVVLLAAAARADRVHLKNGRTLEGEVTDRGDKIDIKMAIGSTTVSKDDVESIESEKGAAIEYQEKAAALAADDAEGHFQLVRWCQERGLKDEARAELLKVIATSPDHAGARALLGHVKVGGAWVDTTTTSVVAVENQMPVSAEVLLDDAKVASVEGGASAEATAPSGEHGLRVALSDGRALSARVTFAPRLRQKLLIPVPQPEHALRICDQGFYLFPSEVQEFDYEGGACRYALLKGGDQLGTLDGSPAPGPAEFDGRGLGDDLGLVAVFNKFQEQVAQKARGARPDVSGSARVQVATGLFVIVDSKELEDVKAGKFRPQSLRLTCDHEVRYAPIESIETGADFKLDSRGEVSLTLGTLLVKVGGAAVTVRASDRGSRGDYAVMRDALVRLVRGSRQEAVLKLEQGVLKPLAGSQPSESPVPPRPGEKPRLPRDAILWGAAGYSVSHKGEGAATRTTFYSEPLIVVLESQPL
jgi:hypothetical protein